MARDFRVMTVDLARESDFELGGLKIRPSTRQVETSGSSETLEPRIMQVLVALARRRGKVVSRDELLEACWGGVAVGENSINRCIYHLRRLGEANQAFSLETITKVGYRLTEVAAAPSLPAPPAISRRLAVISVVAAAGLVVAAIAAIAVALIQPREARSVEISAPRIAVLPFDLVGDSPGAAAAAQRAPAVIAAALLDAGEAVLSPSVSASYTGLRKSGAASALGVAYVIDGEVSGADPVRLMLRLTAADGLVIWSRELTALETNADSLLVQASVRSANALNRLRQFQASGPKTSRQQAAVLRAGDRMETGDMTTAWREARALAQAEPENPEALLAAAIFGSHVLATLPVEDRSEYRRELRDYVARGGAMNPGSPLLPLAVVNTLPSPDFEGRINTLVNAVVASPTDPELRIWLSTELLSVGRLEDGLQHAREAAKLDPFSPDRAWQSPAALLISGRYAEAASESERVLKLWPSHQPALQIRHEALLWLGDHKTARRQLADPHMGPLIQPMAAVRPMDGILDALESRKKGDIDLVIDECSGRSILKGSSIRYCFSALVALGRMSEALDLATRVYPDLRDPATKDWIRGPGLVERLFALNLAALREDPRMILVFERLKLVDYWRSSGQWPDFCETEPRSVCARMKAG